MWASKGARVKGQEVGPWMRRWVCHAKCRPKPYLPKPYLCAQLIRGALPMTWSKNFTPGAMLQHLEQPEQTKRNVMLLHFLRKGEAVAENSWMNQAELQAEVQTTASPPKAPKQRVLRVSRAARAARAGGQTQAAATSGGQRCTVGFLRPVLRAVQAHRSSARCAALDKKALLRALM